MTELVVNDIEVAGMTGSIAAKWDVLSIRAIVSSLSALVQSGAVHVLQDGRNRVVCIDAAMDGWRGRLAVKSFGRRSVIRDMIDNRRGSRARRTFDVARSMLNLKVGTPEPVCFLERWRGSRLVESYYVSVFEEGAVCFKDELIRLLREEPECSLFMNLMSAAAEAIGEMHDAGVMHRDMGNQNILLHRNGDRWTDVKFMDLNRSRVLGVLSLAQRARDISRIYLPSDLLRVFMEMYFKGAVPPPAFLRYEKRFRLMFKWHTKTRSLRHPVRTARRLLRAGRDIPEYPLERDMWIWDSRSAQPIAAMRPKDRRRWYPLSRHLQVVRSSAAIYRDVKREYDSLLPQAYSRKITMRGRIGMALGFDSGDDQRELDLLEELGNAPVLIRLSAHEPASWDRRVALIRKLAGEGREITVALLQDRASVMDPAKWNSFVSLMARQLKGSVAAVEAGHAVNRVKWGLWDLKDYARIVEPVKRHFGSQNVTIMGPAAIDFEYPFVAAALDSLPEEFKFDALSHHLYVDRRGAPENRQSGYATLEKAALLKAIARVHKKLSDRVVISEVNWPIEGTGVWSPVNSPYESPGIRRNDPSVTEDQYADYMIRYLLTVICSGMVDQVFWWRLVARGFGLVDDSDQGSWRKRPAFLMLKQFIKMMDGAAFLSRRVLGDGGTCMMFEGRGGSEFAVCFTDRAPTTAGLPFECTRVLDSFGKDIDTVSRLKLEGRPIYCQRAMA